MGEARVVLFELATHGGVQTMSGMFEFALMSFEPRARRLAGNPRGERAQLTPLQGQLGSERVRQARGQFVEALKVQLEAPAGRDQPPAQLLEFAHLALKPLRDGLGQALAQLRHARLHFEHVRRNQLGRRRRGRGAQVGDQIGDREIDLMADRAHDRNTRVINGARHGFFVERPQVFE